MSRYWVYIDSKIQGPYDVPSLRRAPGFNLLSQVCLEGQKTWSLADDVLEIKSYFLAPPRVSSLTFGVDTDGNTALKSEPEISVASRSETSPLAVLGMGDNLVEELPPLNPINPMPVVAKKEEGKPGALRAVCD